MKMAIQKVTWSVRKSQSAKSVVVVESRGRRAANSANGSVRIHCCSDSKIKTLKGVK